MRYEECALVHNKRCTNIICAGWCMKNSSVCTYLVCGVSPEYTNNMLMTVSQGRSLDCALAMVESSKLVWVGVDFSCFAASIYRV